MRTAAGAVLAAVLIAAAPAFSADEPRVRIPPDHFTRAELDGFRSIATYDEVVAFCRRLAKTSPFLTLEFFGTSGQGRKMPVVLVSKEKEFDPANRWKSRKPWVLLLGSIHGGEVDGTEAILELLRDIALTNRPEILDAVNVLAVPVYNVDGYALVGKWNRPNQNGPAAGMGFRTNARGYDLNRDFVKADAPETRALLALAAAWSPDLFVDNHVTDGADFQPTLTVAFGHEPVTPAPLRSWLDLVVPKALHRVEEWGFGTAPYVEFADRGNPLSGIAPDPFGPRYATGYFGLRNVPSILVETHAIKPFERRVKANALFLAALLDLTGRNGAALLSAREKARAEARGAAAGTPVTVEAATDRGRPEPVDLPTFVWTEEISPVTGKPVVRYDTSQKTTVSVPLFRHAKPVVTVPRPAAYLIPAGWPNLEERLKAHGIRYAVLPTARTLEVGTCRVKSPQYAARPFQGRMRVIGDRRAKVGDARDPGGLALRAARHRARAARRLPAGARGRRLALCVGRDDDRPRAEGVHRPSRPRPARGEDAEGRPEAEGGMGGEAEGPEVRGGWAGRGGSSSTGGRPTGRTRSGFCRFTGSKSRCRTSAAPRLRPADQDEPRRAPVPLTRRTETRAAERPPPGPLFGAPGAPVRVARIGRADGMEALRLGSGLPADAELLRDAPEAPRVSLFRAPALVADGVGGLVEESLQPVLARHVRRDPDDMRRPVRDDAPGRAPARQDDARRRQGEEARQLVIDPLQLARFGVVHLAWRGAVREEVQLSRRVRAHPNTSSLNGASGRERTSATASAEAQAAAVSKSGTTAPWNVTAAPRRTAQIAP